MRNIVALTLFLLFPSLLLASDAFNIEGVMHHTDLEGGCWYLEATQQKYELRGAEEVIKLSQQEGKYLKLRVRKSGGASICMMGQIVTVIEVLDSVRHPVDPMIMRLRVVGKMRKHKRGCWYVRTAKGRTYELQGTVPKRWRKSGARFDAHVRAIAGTYGKCGLQWVVVGLDTPGMKAQEKPRADPR